MLSTIVPMKASWPAIELIARDYSGHQRWPEFPKLTTIAIPIDHHIIRSLPNIDATKHRLITST
jgi:hypothetical protein